MMFEKPKKMTEQEREEKIRLWFAMWLQQKDLGIGGLFAQDALYTESWGPQYHGSNEIRHWFEEWNTRGKVLVWEIRQWFHRDNQTMVEWYFKNQMDDGRVDAFDGVSLILWSDEGQIQALKEFGCNCNNYDPYQNGPVPQFREEPVYWF